MLQNYLGVTWKCIVLPARGSSAEDRRKYSAEEARESIHRPFTLKNMIDLPLGQFRGLKVVVSLAWQKFRGRYAEELWSETFESYMNNPRKNRGSNRGRNSSLTHHFWSREAQWIPAYTFQWIWIHEFMNMNMNLVNFQFSRTEEEVRTIGGS